MATIRSASRRALKALGLALWMGCVVYAAPVAPPLEVLEEEPLKPAAPAPSVGDTVKSGDSAKASDPAKAADPAKASDPAKANATLPSDTSAASDSAKAAAVPLSTPAVPPSASEATEPAAIVGAPSSDEFTVEVDPGQSVNKDRSLPLAMLYSAAVPGAGEFYLRERGDAKAFLLAEAGFWASLYVAFLARESYLTSARNYASEYAGIDASGKSAAFLETMANFRSYQEKQHRQDSYELAQILSGKRDRDYDIKPVEANYWDFGSSANPGNTDNWKTFQSTLRYYRASKVAMSFAVGFLALNRLASLANTLRVYKSTSAKGLGLNVTPEFGPESIGSRLSLRF